MEYYALITVAVLMFGGGFAMQDYYRKLRGSNLKISMESAFIGSIAGLIVLLIVNGFSFKITPFTFFMALLATLNGIAFTFCAFKALDKINLSLFSLFSMLGGMVLPFLQGILFYNEGFSLGKGICVLFIFLALICTIEKGEKKNGTIFYLGVFIFNGMSGVLSKIFTESTLPKTDASEYTNLISVLTIILSGVIWLILSAIEKKKEKNGEITAVKVEKTALYKSFAVGAVQGAINKVANFFLVIALLHVDASVQYPMVTGGTMIVSTLISCFSSKKPSKKEIFSVILAFVAMLALFIIEI